MNKITHVAQLEDAVAKANSPICSLSNISLLLPGGK